MNEEADRVSQLQEQRKRGGYNSGEAGPTIMLNNLVKTYPAPWSLGVSIPALDWLSKGLNTATRACYKALCCRSITGSSGGGGGGGTSITPSLISYSKCFISDIFYYIYASHIYNF